MKTREELLSQLGELDKQTRVVRKQIEDIDHTKIIEDLNQYNGKCFRERNSQDYVRCLFVYGIDEENRDTKSILISYFQDQNDHFQIEYYHLFNPKKYNDEDLWYEVSKEEFDLHYSNVTKMIEDCVKG